MKIIKVLIGLFLIASFAKGQSNYFNKTLRPYGGSSGIETIIKNDNYYYAFIINVDTSNNWRQRIVLLKIDSIGTVIDSNIISYDYFTFASTEGNSMYKLDDNTFIACGGLKDTTSKIEGYLVKFNSNLDTLWTKTYSHPDTLAASQVGADVYNQIKIVKQTLDKGLILSGEYNVNCVTGNVKNYIIKTDSFGNIQYFKTFSSFIYIYDIELAPDSGFYIAGSSNGYLPASIIKTDKLGNLIWNANIITSTLYSHPLAIFLDSNYLYTCCAKYYDQTYERKYLLVSKVNTLTHTKIWEKGYYLYANLNCMSLSQSIHIEKAKDGNIVIGSTALLADTVLEIPTYKGVLLKINPNGDSLWARNYGIGTFEDIAQFDDFIVTDDGGFLGAGFQFTYTGGQSCWIIKLDSFGCDTPGCQSVGINQLQVKSGRLKVYPNPASDFIHLEMDYSRFEDEEIVYKIVDVLGKIQTEGVLAERIDIQQLKPGVYSVILYSNSKAIANEKLTVIK